MLFPVKRSSAVVHTYFYLVNNFRTRFRELGTKAGNPKLFTFVHSYSRTKRISVGTGLR
jgi:hypothetical protein